MKRTFLVSILFLIAAVHAASATSVLPIRDSSLADQAAVIAEGTVTGMGPASTSSGVGRPATEYRLRVERLMKGRVGEDTAKGGSLIVRVPGGLAPNGLRLKIWGAPEFRIGERALLFLVANGDGTYAPLHLALGSFHELRAEGRRLAVRDLSEVYQVAGDASSEGVRDLKRFGDWLTDRAAGVEREADYLVPAPRMSVAWEAFSYLARIKQRWLEFDLGEAVHWRAHVAGQAGLPGGGFAEFQTALQAWNNDPATNIQYVYDGTTTVTTGFQDFDNRNVITFDDFNRNPNDPNSGDAPGSFICSRPGVGEGVLAIGGTWLDDSTTPATIGGADIVINDGASCWFTSGSRAAQVYAHELGHTLGLGHSCGDAANGPCNTNDKDEALMRANAHRDERGAALQKDDRAGILTLYPDPNGSSGSGEPTNLAADEVTRTSVTLSWTDNSSETQFLVQMKKGSSFKIVKRVKKNTTTATITGLSPGKSYTFRVGAKKGSKTRQSESLTIQTLD